MPNLIIYFNNIKFTSGNEIRESKDVPTTIDATAFFSNLKYSLNKIIDMANSDKKGINWSNFHKKYMLKILLDNGI